MDKIFNKFVRLREEKESDSNSIVSKIKLQKGKREFGPFTVNKNSHANLRYIIQAFLDSANVGVGYTTIDKSKGEIEPQLKKKSLFLTGGAVRDHLKGKTPRNYDLVTDATPSEIEMILTQSEQEFTKTKPPMRLGFSKKEYQNLPLPEGNNKIFYPCRWDRKGKELEICVEINGEKFYISTLSKTPKSRNITPEEGVAATSIEEDAANRDFTINALYIPLNTADGDNVDLLDPVGGAHDLQKNALVPVGDDLEERMKEDPNTGFRYAKFNSRFNKNHFIPKKHQEIIANHAQPLSFNKETTKNEFVNGLEHPDSSPRNFIKNLDHTNLLSLVFPGLEFNTENIPPTLMGDRWLATAWILKNNNPNHVRHVLMTTGWSKQEASDIAHLIQMYHHSSSPQNMMGCPQPALTRSKVKDWMKLIGMPQDFEY